MRRLLRRTLRWLGLAVVVVLCVVLVSALAMRLVQPPVTSLQAIRLIEGNGFDRQVVAIEAMTPHLPRAVIAADGRIAHANVVQVIDILRQEQITKFAINVRPEEIGR